MKHLKDFEQLNESLVADNLRAITQKLANKDNKSIIELFLPYKHLLKPYYKKYYVNGAIQADLIESDLRGFNFTAKTNEGWEREYDEDDSNPLLLRILYKIFYKFPKSVIDMIVGFVKDILDDLRHGQYFRGLVRSFIGIAVAVVVWILGIFAYQCTDYIFNGLEKGVSIGGSTFEPAHYETHVHTVNTGKTHYTYTTHDFVPDRWHVEVRGIEDKDRVEKWVTYSKSIGEDVWKGDTLLNDESWTWEITEEN